MCASCRERPDSQPHRSSTNSAWEDRTPASSSLKTAKSPVCLIEHVVVWFDPNADLIVFLLVWCSFVFDFFFFLFYSGEHTGSVKQRCICDDERLRSGETGACSGTCWVRITWKAWLYGKLRPDVLIISHKLLQSIGCTPPKPNYREKNGTYRLENKVYRYTSFLALMYFRVNRE